MDLSDRSCGCFGFFFGEGTLLVCLSSGRGVVVVEIQKRTICGSDWRDVGGYAI